MDTKRFSALIESVYAAAAGGELWPAAAAQIAGFFGSESTAIQVRSGSFGNIRLRATTTNYDAEAQRAYAAHFHKTDLWANRWRAIGASGIYAGAELVDPETLRRSEYYTDWCRNRGIFHFLGAGVDLDEGTSLLLGIHRPMERDDFTPAHRRTLELVLPHLVRAVQLHMALATSELHRRLSAEAFAALSIATIVIDAEHKVVFANDLAEQLLRAGDGLVIRQSRLTTRDSRLEPALRQAITRTTLTPAGKPTPPADVLLVRRFRKQPLSVLVAPLITGTFPLGAAAVLFVGDPEARRPPATAALAALYHLTPAEARLLEALLHGQRISEYADSAGVSANTANTQLKQLFAKTDTNRQSDLMRQVSSDPIASLAQARRAFDG